MAILIGLVPSFALGIVSMLTNRLRGTLLVALPLTGWFVWFGFVLSGGMKEPEVSSLCYALLGIVIGTFLGQMVARRRSGSRHR